MPLITAHDQNAAHSVPIAPTCAIISERLDTAQGKAQNIYVSCPSSMSSASQSATVAGLAGLMLQLIFPTIDNWTPTVSKIIKTYIENPKLNQKELLEKSINEKFNDKLKVKEEAIKMKDDEIARLKDFKQKLSTKMVGETLEQHCETEFNRIRAIERIINKKFEKKTIPTGKEICQKQLCYN